MRNDYLQTSIDRRVWTSAAAVFLLWTAVVVLAVSGVAMLSVHGDTGALLLVTALVVAAPAAALSQYRSSV